MDDACRQLRGIVSLVAAGAIAGTASAGPIYEGFDAAALPAASPKDTVRFFGHTFDSLRVDARGNVSFAAPLPEFAPVPLGLLRDANISPFFAESDVAVLPTGGHGLGTSGTAAGHVAPSAGQVARTHESPRLTSGGPASQGGEGGAEGGAAGAGGSGNSLGRRAASAGYGFAALRSMFPVVGGPSDGPNPAARAVELDPADAIGLDLDPTFEMPGVTDGPEEVVSEVGDVPPGVVGTPEPGTLVLGLIGSVGLLAARRRKATP